MDPAEFVLGSHLAYQARERAGYPSWTGAVLREQMGRSYYQSAEALTVAARREEHKSMSFVVASVSFGMHLASHSLCSKPALLASHPRQ